MDGLASKTTEFVDHVKGKVNSVGDETKEWVSDTFDTVHANAAPSVAQSMYICSALVVISTYMIA